MNNETIMHSNLLDILFENRNKAYGAYSLRKNYSKRLYKALGIMSGLVLLFSAYSFIPKKQKPMISATIISAPLMMPDAKKEKKETEKPKEAIKKNTQAPVQKVLQNPVIVNEEVKTDTLSRAEITNPGNVEVAATGTDPGVEPDPSSNPGEGVPELPKTEKVPDINEPMEADVVPQYPGGEKALRRFLEKNLHDPNEDGTQEKITVTIKFIVGYDGKLRGFEVIKDGGDLYNDEVKRVLKKMPEWIPGKTKGGQNVTTWYTVPVSFLPIE